MVDGSGEITVTTRKVSFGHPKCPLDLAWGGLDTIDLVAPEVFETGFRNIHNGQRTTVQLHTPWASLLFVLAAVTAFPAHPPCWDAAGCRPTSRGDAPTWAAPAARQQGSC
ncbi:hypothetical protein [Streptomyces sp. NPDC020951]|uniref:hypothetical protein n=1 Tax=Streptomyces sp. NPDC020951 TaxID=3365104 RepID=UPI0037A98F78